MSGLRYTKEHEWLRVEGDVATIGITDYAQEKLGDIVFIDLPAPGNALVKGGEAAVIESVKAASEIYAPVGGEVVEVNRALEADPAIVNADPLGKGGFLKLRLADSSECDALMEEAAYQDYVKELA